MSDQSTILLKFDQSPEEVFEAVIDVRGWWSKNVRGNTAATNDEFEYEVPGLHSCRIRVTEAVPNQHVVWLVLANSFSFIEEQEEWTGTEIRFDIRTSDDGATELTFCHVGLVPEFECYEVCHKSWRFYVGHSLHRLVTTGTGLPNRVADDAAVLGPRIEAALADQDPSLEGMANHR